MTSCQSKRGVRPSLGDFHNVSIRCQLLLLRAKRGSRSLESEDACNRERFANNQMSKTIVLCFGNRGVVGNNKGRVVQAALRILRIDEAGTRARADRIMAVQKRGE